MRLFATGLTGTIGQYLRPRVESLSIRLDEEFNIDPDLVSNSTVIHLGAIVGEVAVRNTPLLSRKINVDASVRLARIVKDAPGARFLYVSTSHVYETPRTDEFLTESSPVLPRGQYALQKLLAEELVKQVFHDAPKRLVIARVFSVIDNNQPTGTLGHSIRQLITNESHQLSCSDDERDFLSPRMVSNILHAIAWKGNVQGYINICSGTPLRVRDVAAMLIPRDLFRRVESRILAGHSSVPRIVGSADRLNGALGFERGELFTQFAEELRAHT